MLAPDKEPHRTEPVLVDHPASRKRAGEHTEIDAHLRHPARRARGVAVGAHDAEVGEHRPHPARTERKEGRKHVDTGGALGESQHADRSERSEPCGHRVGPRCHRVGPHAPKQPPPDPERGAEAEHPACDPLAEAGVDTGRNCPRGKPASREREECTTDKRPSQRPSRGAGPGGSKCIAALELDDALHQHQRDHGEHDSQDEGRPPTKRQGEQRHGRATDHRGRRHARLLESDRQAQSRKSGTREGKVHCGLVERIHTPAQREQRDHRRERVCDGGDETLTDNRHHQAAGELAPRSDSLHQPPAEDR